MSFSTIAPVRARETEGPPEEVANNKILLEAYLGKGGEEIA